MAFQNGHVLRVTLHAQHSSGVDEVNTFHYDLHDSSTPGNAANSPQSLADFFRDNVMGPFKALYNDEWTILPIVVVDEKDPLNPAALRSSWVSGVAGAGTRFASGDRMPKACCGVATLITTNIGRRARGRKFLGGHLVEGDQADGNWQTTPLGLWQTFLNAVPHQPDIATGTSESTADWSVYSRTARAQDQDNYLFHVQSTLLRSKVHWLRSRER